MNCRMSPTARQTVLHRFWHVFWSLLATVVPAPAQAHEIPQRVAITILARHESDRLRLLVRVPLESTRDVDFAVRADGTLDIALAMPLLREAATVWLVSGLSVFEDGNALDAGRLIAARLATPSDRSFASYNAALTHLQQATVDTSLKVRREDALLDVWLEYPVKSASAQFEVEPALANLGVRTVTVLRYVLPSGAERAFQYTGDPGRIALDPRWYQAARTFVSLGFLHILGGLDHLLFVFCLVIPVRRWQPLVAIVSAFTVAHSLTLATAAFGVTPQALWFPPLVETLIAASIVYMAIENVLRPAEVLERRWPLAFAFGLVHGFGFSFALQESLQFVGSHLLTSLAAFNVGVELGQVAVLAVAVPLLLFVARRVPNRFALTVAMSALVAHSAWHWMTERGSELLAHDVTWTAPSLLVWLGLLRGALLLAVAALVAWGLSGVFDRLSAAPTAQAQAREQSAWCGADGDGSALAESGASPQIPR